jgi:hypothetical protein
MKEKEMKTLELIVEQIKTIYPAAHIHQDVPNKTLTLSLVIEPFGEVIISNDFNIRIKYSNPFLTDFNIFKSFFNTRLNVKGYEAYIYEKEIVLYKRMIEASSDFEKAIIRANSFIEVIRSIEKFIDWNHTLNKS